MLINCLSFDPRIWRDWMAEAPFDGLYNPFIQPQTLIFWLEKSPDLEEVRMIRLQSKKARLAGVLCKSAGIWRACGFDLFDYAPLTFHGNWDDRLIIVSRGLSHLNMLPARIDRIFCSGHGPSRTPRGFGLRTNRSQTFQWSASEEGGIGGRAAMHRQLVSRMERNVGMQVEKVQGTDELAEAFEAWRKFKHEWVLRTCRRYFLSKDREKSILARIVQSSDLPMKAWILRTQDGSIAAVLIGFLNSDKALGYYLTSYNDQFRRFSPSVLLLLEVVQREGVRSIDFMWGEEDYKRRFANSQHTLLTLRLSEGRGGAE